MPGVLVDDAHQEKGYLPLWLIMAHNGPLLRTSKLGVWSAERTSKAFYGVTRSALHRRGSDSGVGGVGTLASARALHPLYENVPYFRDGDGELRRSVAPT
jgi:hypothetical protein